MPLLDRTDFTTCLNANLRLVARAVDAIYRRHLKPFGLTESQLNLLATVAQFRTIEQSRVGKILCMERSTVSRDLRRLLDRGLMLREGPANRFVLSLSEVGEKFMETIIPVWERAMAETAELLGDDAASVYALRDRVRKSTE